MRRFQTGFFTALLICLATAESAPAQYKNKLSILPVANPAGWTAAYAPGPLVKRMLEHSVRESGTFHLLPVPKKGDAGAGAMRHPVQYLIRGNVLKFDPGEPPTKAQKVFDAPETIKQRAEIAIEIEILSHHAKESLARKRFDAESISGVIPFEFDGTRLDFTDAAFQRTSIGKTLLELNRQISDFITHTLYVLPLEGEVIAVDMENKEILINLGRENGVGFGDDFTVYSVVLNQTDPFSKQDLGGRFTRQGVVRVRQVQARFAIAAIMAGTEFAKGQLVRSRRTNPAYRPRPFQSAPGPSPARTTAMRTLPADR